MFVRHAPAVMGAFDKIHKEEQEREQRKAKTSQEASQQHGPRYSGR